MATYFVSGEASNWLPVFQEVVVCAPTFSRGVTKHPDPGVIPGAQISGRGSGKNQLPSIRDADFSATALKHFILAF